jgi:hypothetical protein
MSLKHYGMSDHKWGDVVNCMSRQAEAVQPAWLEDLMDIEWWYIRRTISSHLVHVVLSSALNSDSDLHQSNPRHHRFDLHQHHRMHGSRTKNIYKQEKINRRAHIMSGSTNVQSTEKQQTGNLTELRTLTSAAKSRTNRRRQTKSRISMVRKTVGKKSDPKVACSTVKQDEAASCLGRRWKYISDLGESRWTRSNSRLAFGSSGSTTPEVERSDDVLAIFVFVSV